MYSVLIAMYRASILLLAFVSILYNSNPTSAQIAPTNTATISGSVSNSLGKPVARAKVSLSGLRSTSTQTDMQGLFVFVGMPFGTYQISVAAVGLGTATRSVTVQGDTNVAIQYEPPSGNGLKVIAEVSTAANAQFNVTSASITQVNPIANAFEGKTSWRTILEQIPGVAQAGLYNGADSFAAMPDSPFVPVAISIDGTLPYETATLVDNMPLIGGSFGGGPAGYGTDLGLYPLNGFGAADVVRGPGANAPSIVNSIGGSFVLHSPGAVSKNHYDLSLSTDPYGGIVANALAAVRWSKLSTVLTYGVYDSPGPLTKPGIPGSPLLTPSQVDGQAFSPYVPPCSSPCQFGSFLFSPNYVNGFYGTQSGFLMCCFDISAPWSQHSGSLSLNYAFSPSVNAEIFYAGELSQGPSAYYNCTDNFVPPAGYTGGVSAGQQIFNGSFLGAPLYDNQLSSLLEEKLTAQLGRGLVTLAALQNRTSSWYSYTVPTSATMQLFGGGTLNGVPTIFNGDTHTVIFTLPSFQPPSTYVFSGNANRDLLLNYTTDLGENFHAGFSFVKSYYNTPEQIDYTITIRPSAVSQTTNETRVFIGGNPSRRTSFDFSIYFANADYHVQDPNNMATYVDARYNYTAPRLGFVWRPTAAVSIRASAGGGFAEAPLQDLIGSNGIPLNSGLGYYTITLNNVNLKPEKSFAFDLGTDVRLHQGTVLSLDVYRSNLYGQIYNSTSVTGMYLGLPLYTTQYGNLGVSRFEGVLLDLRHNVPHGTYWSLSGGLTRGYVVSLPAGFYNTAGGTCNPSTGANCANVTVVPNVNFNGQFAASIPYAQGLGTFGYRWNAEKYVDVVGTYYGNNNTYFRPAFVEWDGHVRYPLTKQASLLATFRNITGIYDNAVQTFSPANLSGSPTISGLPYPLYGEEYGPRTVILTLNVSL